MTENLIIRLGSNAEDPIQWMVCSVSDHSIIASGDLPHADQLTQLTEKASSREVTTIVPTSDVALRSLNVPAKSQKAIRLAAPFMLEDDLAQDVEQLFFAYSDVKNVVSENCFIAAVARQQMKQWQAWLNDADIMTKRMIPDALLLPEANPHWQAIMMNKQVLVRQGGWQGMLLDEQHWSHAIESYLLSDDVTIEAHSILPASQSTITTTNEVDRDDKGTLTITVMPEELPLAIFAQHLHSQTFNLLQGEFKIKTARSPLIKTWAWAASIALFALLLNVGFKSVKLWQLNNQQTAVEQKIIDTYKAAFPQTKRVRVSTIRSQLKRKLAEIGSTSQSVSFLSVLASVQPAFSQISQIKPASLKFDSKRSELRLQATANDYQQFEQFKTLLEKQNMAVSQGAQNNQGDKISGSFSISPAKGDRS